MSDAGRTEDQVKRLVQGAASFADEMRVKGIHLGMPRHGRVVCVTCDMPWPCAAGSVGAPQGEAQ
jgi:hypothetical protein